MDINYIDLPLTPVARWPPSTPPSPSPSSRTGLEVIRAHPEKKLTAKNDLKILESSLFTTSPQVFKMTCS